MYTSVSGVWIGCTSIEKDIKRVLNFSIRLQHGKLVELGLDLNRGRRAQINDRLF